MVELKAFHKKWGNPILWMCVKPILLALFIVNGLLMPLYLFLLSPVRIVQIFHRKKWFFFFSPVFFPFYLGALIGSMPIFIIFNLYMLFGKDISRLLKNKAFWRKPDSITKPWGHYLLETHTENKKPRKQSLGLIDVYAFTKKPKPILYAYIFLQSICILLGLYVFLNEFQNMPIILANPLFNTLLLCILSLSFGPFCSVLYLHSINRDRVSVNLPVSPL